MTDGLTSYSDRGRLNVSSSNLQNIAHVVAVGVAGKGYNAKRKFQQRAELSQIASSDEAVFYEPSFRKLRDHVGPIAPQACPLVFKKSHKV